jgi:hypothetical protein
MVTVQEKLQSLRQSLTEIGNQETSTWKEKQKAQKRLLANQEAIANLEKYQQLKVNDWVANQQEVGQIIAMNLSPGGMPDVFVTWNDSVPIPEHTLEKLIVLEDNWNQGFTKGDVVVLNKPILTKYSSKLEDNSSLDKEEDLEVSDSKPNQRNQEGKQIVTIVKFEWSKDYNCVLPLVKDNQTNEQQLVFFEDLFAIEMDESVITEEKSDSDLVNSDLKIIIDPEFKSLIPILSPEEKSQLENNLLAEGCRDPLVIWKGYNILLDGHNRYEICLKNGLDYELIEIELPSREDAHLWMMRNQLGRRNLQPEALSYFRGKLHQVSKQKQGRKSQDYEKNMKKSQNDTFFLETTDANVDTGQSLAKELKVGRATIYRDSQYAKAVDTIARVMGEEIRPKILSKTTGKNLTKKKTLELAKTAKHNPDEVVEFFNPNPILLKSFYLRMLNHFPFR